MSDKGDKNLSQDQLQALLQYASKKLGTTPEKLVKTVNQGNLSSLTSGMSPGEAAKVQSLMSDQKKAEQLISSPEAKQLIQKILEQRKK